MGNGNRCFPGKNFPTMSDMCRQIHLLWAIISIILSYSFVGAARQIAKSTIAGMNNAATGQSSGNSQIKAFRCSAGGKLCCYRIGSTHSGRRAGAGSQCIPLGGACHARLGQRGGQLFGTGGDRWRNAQSHRGTCGGVSPSRFPDWRGCHGHVWLAGLCGCRGSRHSTQGTR